jgi:teichuronic acid biosynthesis glycosyltransferase TuaG
MPTISVIIPYFEAGEFIAEALESLESQSVPPDEIICVNDGSTDGGPQIVEDFAKAHSALKLIHIHQNNRGLGSARNTGLKACTCDYIAWLDADDIFTNNKIDLVKSYLNKYPDTPWLMHAALDWKDNKLRKRFFYTPENTAQLLSKGNPFLPSATVLQTELARKYPLMEDPPGAGTEDLDLWIRLYRDDILPEKLSVPLTHYRIHAKAMSQQLEKHLQRTIFCLEKNSIRGSLFRKAIQRKYYESARVLQRRGDHTGAAKFYRMADLLSLKTIAACILNTLKIKA